MLQYIFFCISFCHKIAGLIMKICCSGNACILHISTEHLQLKNYKLRTQECAQIIQSCQTAKDNMADKKTNNKY